MSVGRLVLALGTVGMIEASTTWRPSTPCILPVASTTDFGVGGRAHLAGADRVEVVEAVATEVLGGNHAGRFV